MDLQLRRPLWRVRCQLADVVPHCDRGERDAQNDSLGEKDAAMRAGRQRHKTLSSIRYGQLQVMNSNITLIRLFEIQLKQIVI